MIWSYFKNEHRDNPKEDFEHESKRKMSKREMEIKMGTTGQGKCYTERRKNTGRN